MVREGFVQVEEVGKLVFGHAGLVEHPLDCAIKLFESLAPLVGRRRGRRDRGSSRLGGSIGRGCLAADRDVVADELTVPFDRQRLLGVQVLERLILELLHRYLPHGHPLDREDLIALSILPLLHRSTVSAWTSRT